MFFQVNVSFDGLSHAKHCAKHFQFTKFVMHCPPLLAEVGIANLAKIIYFGKLLCI